MIDLPNHFILAKWKSEAKFKTAWQTILADTEIQRAVCAGIRADRLSWVFISGYQSAVRLAFDGIPEEEWWSFAVSEDKSGRLPSVKISDGVLSGSKTWVAACDHVDGLIVNTGGKCYQISRHAEGVHLNRYTNAKFLPEMSTGKLTLKDVVVDEPIQMKVDFRLAESVALMAASSGYVWREAKRYGEHLLLENCENVFGQLAVLELTDSELIGDIYGEVVALGKTCSEIATNRADASEKDWQQNGRLLSLHSRGLNS